jgi:hypothetical protein
VGDEPQLFVALTYTIPEVPDAVAFRTLVLEFPNQPTGMDQLYDVAPLTGDTLKTSWLPEQTIVFP